MTQGKNTALMHAASNGHSECVRVLVEGGAELNALGNMRDIDSKNRQEFEFEYDWEAETVCFQFVVADLCADIIYNTLAIRIYSLESRDPYTYVDDLFTTLGHANFGACACF